MEKEAESILGVFRQDEETEAQGESEVRATAHGLIQGYIGPDHKVIDMKSFYAALVYALKQAREKGRMDGRTIGTF